LVAEIPDLYRLEGERLAALERFGEKSAENLIAAIEDSRGRTLDRFLFGLGIRHVGRTTARALALSLGSIEAVAAATEEELAAIPDVGPTIARSVSHFFRAGDGGRLVKELLAVGVRPAPLAGAARADSPFRGKKVVLTGTLGSMKRSEARDRIEADGGKVVASVSKKTDFVIAGEGGGSNRVKAESLGVPILNEEDFLAMLGGSK